MLRTSRRILSGVIKLPTFGIPTAQERMLDEISFWELEAFSPNLPRAESPLKGTASETTIYRGRLSDRHIDSSSQAPLDASRM
jgi:hypothetical protein